MKAVGLKAGLAFLMLFPAYALAAGDPESPLTQKQAQAILKKYKKEFNQLRINAHLPRELIARRGVHGGGGLAGTRTVTYKIDLAPVRGQRRSGNSIGSVFIALTSNESLMAKPQDLTYSRSESIAISFIPFSPVNENALPFDEYLSYVRSAKADAYLGKPGRKVKTRTDFEKMRKFILARYQGRSSSKSFPCGANSCECFPKPPHPTPTPDPGAPAPAKDPGEICGLSPYAGFTWLEIARNCGEDSLPLERFTLDELTRCRSVEIDSNDLGPDTVTVSQICRT